MKGHPQGWALVIAGPDEAGHVWESKELIQRLGLQGLVQFVGPVSGEDRRDAFVAADAFIMPSHAEGLPMALPEAIAGYREKSDADAVNSARVM